MGFSGSNENYLWIFLSGNSNFFWLRAFRLGQANSCDVCQARLESAWRAAYKKLVALQNKDLLWTLLY